MSFYDPSALPGGAVAPEVSKDDYAEINYTGTETNYMIGTNAFAADPNVPWGATFVAKRVLLLPTTNCLVRFNGASRVQHLLLANQQYEVLISIERIYVVRQVADGVLYIHAEA